MFDLLFNKPNDGDEAFHTALDRYRDKVVVSGNFDFQNGVQAITPNAALIAPPQFQDDRVGFVNFWPDEIDGKTRAATYRVTNRQLAGLPPEVRTSFSGRLHRGQRNWEPSGMLTRSSGKFDEKRR
jgi:hypothetical protein